MDLWTKGETADGSLLLTEASDLGLLAGTTPGTTSPAIPCGAKCGGTLTAFKPHRSAGEVLFWDSVCSGCQTIHRIFND